MDQPGKLGGVLESCLYADDLNAIEPFYAGVIGLDVHSRDDGRHVFFRCGSGMLLVFNPEHTSTIETDVAGAKIPLHGCRGTGHVALAVADEDLAAWRLHFQRAGVEIESEIAWPAGGRSIYVRDPAGNSLELATPSIWGLPPVAQPEDEKLA